MDERARLQQFYLRTVLAVGLLWGAFLLVQLLELALSPGTKGSFVNALAVVVNCLSIFPACILAFWHRRAACAWLALNAAFITATTIRTILHTHHYYWGFNLSVVLSIALAVCLITIEARGWPGALAPEKH